MSLTLNGYQLNASKTAVYTGRDSFLGLMYVSGKLAGETGEIAENVFKALRDDGLATITQTRAVTEPYSTQQVAVSFGYITTERREKIKKELGDALWYISQVAYELGFTLEEVAVANNLKLADRAERGVLHGSGDER